MLTNTLLVLGLAASVASGAPVNMTPVHEVAFTHTVTIDEGAIPTPTIGEDAVGAGIGYGTIAPTEAAESVETEVATTTAAILDETTVVECAPTTAAAYGAMPAESETPSPAAAAAAAAPADHQHAAQPTETPAASNSTTVEQPVAPVVPVNICTNNGTHCLTTVGSEFADVKLSFDNVATFSLGLDGLLVRLNDLKCVDAVPMDNATWYDLAYVNCTLPNYLQGALEFSGNGIGPDNTTNTTVLPEGRAATLTQAVLAPSSTADATATATETAEATTEEGPRLESHTIWLYNSTTSYLCAHVNDGLNDIAKVCMYSDEGYAMLATTQDLKNVPRKNREVTMPVVQKDNTTLAEQLANMLMAMTYDGQVFWYASWNTNIETVMKYRMMPHEEDINMGRDEITGIVWPLWQVINDCRTTCDIYAWCRSFTFHIHERVCTLSSNNPTVEPNELNREDPDMVTFSQNSNYNREDFVLPEDIKTDIPSRRRRIVRRA